MKIFKKKLIYHTYSNGFLMIELLVGLILSSFCILIVRDFTNLCFKTHQQTIDKIQAIEYAQTFIERSICKGGSGLSRVGQTSYDGRFLLSWRIAPYAFSTYQKSVERILELQELLLSISWQEDDKKQNQLFFSTILYLEMNNRKSNV